MGIGVLVYTCGVRIGCAPIAEPPSGCVASCVNQRTIDIEHVKVVECRVQRVMSVELAGEWVVASDLVVPQIVIPATGNDDLIVVNNGCMR